jgi:F420-dependent oxidoreductase-like protein
MELRIFTEPQQGATYDDLLAVASTAERAGFGGFFRSDHYLKMGDVTGLPGPTHCWASMAGLARDTSTIRLGTLVSPVTFYRPGPLAITVAQVDQMSGGRVELGLGTGWYEAEHTAYGLSFPPLGERFAMMEEYLEQITGLWTTAEGATYSNDGQFHSFTDSPALPKPAQRPTPPIVIGGRGRHRTPALAARFASDFNQAFRPVTDIGPQLDRVRAACEKIGRDPGEITPSVALVMCLGATRAEVERRAAAIGREPDELRMNGLAGSADEILTKLATYAEAGCQRAYLQVLDLADLDHVAEAGAELIPGAAGL